ncbi:unnamed protein product (macronuclear) [Paramecium tetraurelia]|uniref:PH domain-containing protein n=1 Tax=Paramecium tetraurelia TaxID=5888 RepID=A0D1S5_PARTE|nr:uncharacterized protein GSPATT00012516001 [Paramecium tetraurelia]CAK76992.1 unnamed protein product [Paramecium tetraurelia]|eukprot:XP_001444389.1 hypothetical protein (macronuclear) [Paramecium tetraurelia strain d4-2]
MFNHKSKRPSLLYIECKSRDLSRRNSRLSDIFDDTINKQNIQQQQRQLSTTSKKPASPSLNTMYRQAISDQQVLQDQTQMLIEDLNGKLLQRAEFIGQIEELEELIDYHKKHSCFEIAFVIRIEKLEILIQQQQKYSRNATELLRQKELYYDELNKIVYQEALNALGMYLKQWGQQFDLIQNNYGPETYQQLVAEKEQEFIQNMTILYDKKIRGITQLFRNYQYIDKSIKSNVEFVDTNLNQELYNVKQAIKQNQELIQKILRIHLEEGISSNLNEKMQTLELKNIRLAQKLNEIARNQTSTQEKIKTKKETEELYHGNLTGFDDISYIDFDELQNERSNSQQKLRDFKGQHNNSQTQSFFNYHGSQETQSKLNQFQQTYQSKNFEMETKYSEGQCTSEDSTLQHFQELNLALIQSGKSLDGHTMKFQPQQSLTIQDNLSPQQNIFLRLQTITEEQLSSKRNRQKMDQKQKIDPSPVNIDLKNILNLKTIKQIDNSTIPLTDQTKRFSNNEVQSMDQFKNQIEINQKYKKMPSSNGSLFFSNQVSIPSSTQKNKNEQFFKSKDSLSEKLSKQKKSKSFDSTSNKEQLKSFIANSSTNNGQTKEIQKVQNTINQLTPIEQEILKILKPLQKGQQIYKRFSTTKPNLTKQEFDPFTCSNPANCGFCPRIICLSKNLDSIEFKNQMRQVDATIKLEEIMRAMIPSTIQQSISIKKQIQCKYILSKQESAVCKILFWPMSLITQNDGRIELLFSNEQVLEQWQANLLFLKDNIKTLQSINKKLNQ